MAIDIIKKTFLKHNMSVCYVYDQAKTKNYHYYPSCLSKLDVCTDE